MPNTTPRSSELDVYSTKKLENRKTVFAAHLRKCDTSKCRKSLAWRNTFLNKLFSSSLNEREKLMMEELEHCKTEGIQLLERGEQRAKELRAESERAPSMSDRQVNDLRDQIRVRMQFYFWFGPWVMYNFEISFTCILGGFRENFMGLGQFWNFPSGFY